MGATVGRSRHTRARYHLRQCFVFLNMYPLNKPEVMIANASKRFDEQVNLTGQNTRDHVKKLVEALAQWTRQLQKAKS